MLMNWLKRKYKELGKVSIGNFISDMKDLDPSIFQKTENIIKLAEFVVGEFFERNTINYKFDSYSHEHILNDYTGNCLMKGRLLGMIFDGLGIPTIGAIAPGHFFTIIELPTKELLLVDGNLEILIVTRKIGFQKNETYKWLVLGSHKNLVYSSTMAWKGSFARVSGDFDRAEMYYMLAFEGSLNEAYSCPDFIFNYANILLAKNKFCEAAMNYHRCLVIDQDYDEAREPLKYLMHLLASRECNSLNCQSFKFFCYHDNKSNFDKYNNAQVILTHRLT